MTQESASTIEQDLAEAISSVSKLRRDDYPSDWQIVKLGEIIGIQGGSQPPKDQFIYEPREGYVRLLQIRDFGDKPVPTYVPKDKVTKFCNQEDIFIARYGASLGRIVTNMEGAYNVALAKVIFDCAVVFPKYIFYLLQTPYFQTPIHMISRSAQNGFNKGEIFPIEVPLAPLQSQKRIVAEIEKQFSRLDEAVANLKRVKANLKRYKAAVLKAAVEGELTAEWRKQHPNVEPASKLLERILTERREKWNGKGKYEEPSAPETTDLPSLPKGWTWATVEQLSMLVQYGSSAKTREEAIGVPVLRMGNIEDSRLRIDSLKYLPKNHDEFPGLFLREGDILFNRTNSAELVGKTAVYKGKPDPCSFASYLIRVRLVQGCAPDLLAYFISSVFGRTWIAQVVSQQVGQANVNGTKLQALAVPLPPLDEQGQIVAEVERRLSVIDELEAAVEANLTRANRLRQSILSQAFSGRLLGQNTKHIPEIMPALSTDTESPARYGEDNRAGW